MLRQLWETNNAYCWDTYRISFFSYLNSFLDNRHKWIRCSWYCCWCQLTILRYHLHFDEKDAHHFNKPTSSNPAHGLSQIKGKTLLLAVALAPNPKQWIWLVTQKSLIVVAIILIAWLYIWIVKHMASKHIIGYGLTVFWSNEWKFFLLNIFVIWERE